MEVVDEDEELVELEVDDSLDEVDVELVVVGSAEVLVVDEDGGSDAIEVDDVKGGSLVVDGGTTRLLGGAEGPELGALEGGSLTALDGILEVELTLLGGSALTEVDDAVDAGGSPLDDTERAEDGAETIGAELLGAGGSVLVEVVVTLDPVGSLLDALDAAADTDGALEAGGSTLTGAVGSDDPLDGGIVTPEDAGITFPKAVVVDPGGSRLLDDELDEEVERSASKMAPVADVVGLLVVVLVVRVEGPEVDVPVDVSVLLLVDFPVVAGGSTEVVSGLPVVFDVLVVFGLLEVVDVFVVFVEEVCLVELEVVTLAFNVSDACAVVLVVLEVVFGFLLVVDFFLEVVFFVVAAFA